MRHTLYALLLSLPLLLSAVSVPVQCPQPSEVRLVPGEYAWVTDDSRFEAYFVSPQAGRGFSTAVVGFAQARWMQLNNLPKSVGVIECDYAGNYGGEVIRVVQGDQQSSPKPMSQFWSCGFNPVKPSTQCTCSGSVTECAF